MGFLLFSLITSGYLSSLSLHLLKELSLDFVPEFNILAHKSKDGVEEWRVCDSENWIIFYKRDGMLAPPPCVGNTSTHEIHAHAAALGYDLGFVVAVDRKQHQVHVQPSAASFGTTPAVMCVVDSGMLFVSSESDVALLTKMGESSAGSKLKLECREMVSIWTPVVLDLSLLDHVDSRGGEVGTATSGWARSHEWGGVCADLHVAMTGPGEHFTLTHGHLSGHPGSMQHWLSLCGAEGRSVVVHQRRPPRLLEKCGDTACPRESRCLVEHVKDPAGRLRGRHVNASFVGHGHVFSSKEGEDSPAEEPLLCLEDVLRGLLRRGSSLVFVSPGPGATGRSGVDTLVEVMAVTAAFQVVTRELLEEGALVGEPAMIVRAGWTGRPAAEEARTQGSPRPGGGGEVNELFAEVRRAVTKEEWDAALIELLLGWQRALFSHEHVHKRRVLVQYQLVHSLIRWTDLLHTRECREAETSGELNIFLCVNPLGRRQLGLLVMDVLVMALDLQEQPALETRPLSTALALATALTEWTDNSQSQPQRARKKLREGLDPLSVLAERFPHADGAYQVAAREMSVGAFIFVTNLQEQAEVESRVAQWSQRCPLCSLCVSYMILPVLREGVRNNGTTFRSVLLMVQEWIEAKSVNLDLVLVLDGVEAVRAFIPPGTPGSLIPLISMEHASYFQVPHDVVFAKKFSEFSASNSRESRSETSCEELVDFRAFVGLAYQVRGLLQLALGDPEGFFSDSRLRRSFAKHVCASELLAWPAAVDMDQRLFVFANQKYGVVSVMQHETLICKISDVFGSGLDGCDGASIHYVQRVHMTARATATPNPPPFKITFQLYWRMEMTLRPMTLEQKILHIEKDMAARNFFSGFQNLLALYLADLTAEGVAEQVAIVLYRYARQLKYFASPALDLAGCLDMLMYFVPRVQTAIGKVPGVSDVVQSLYTMVGAIYTELGSVTEAVNLFSEQIMPVSYTSVHRARQRWHEQRKRYASLDQGFDPDRGYKVHFFTVASDNTTGLQNLEFTASLAGVQLRVLGLGRQYTSWLQKFEWYAEALLIDDNITCRSGSGVADDDIVVLMDAYDVLLTPVIRRIGQHLARSPTPLLTCAENGQYPEPEAPWLYPRGSSSAFASSSASAENPSERSGMRRVGGSTRFLNSGCLVGRARDVKDFLREIFHEMTLVQDDQQVFARYFLRNPHLMSVDAETRQGGRQQSAVFQCGWRVPVEAFTELAHTGVARFHGDFLPVGMFHMNNRQSEPLYLSLVEMFRRLHAACFQGQHGPVLLQALHLLMDGDYDGLAEKLDTIPVHELRPEQVRCRKSIVSAHGLPEGGF